MAFQAYPLSHNRFMNNGFLLIRITLLFQNEYYLTMMTMLSLMRIGIAQAKCQ